MGFMGGFPEIEGCKQREHVCLQEGNQEFNQVHENHEERGEHACTHSNAPTELFSKNEDQRGKGQNDDVPSSDVRGQTNHQDGGLNEDAGNLDGDENELNGKGHS